MRDASLSQALHGDGSAGTAEEEEVRHHLMHFHSDWCDRLEPHPLVHLVSSFILSSFFLLQDDKIKEIK
jgi:hypothetical protein